MAAKTKQPVLVYDSAFLELDEASKEREKEILCTIQNRCYIHTTAHTEENIFQVTRVGQIKAGTPTYSEVKRGNPLTAHSFHVFPWDFQPGGQVRGIHIPGTILLTRSQVGRLPNGIPQGTSLMTLQRKAFHSETENDCP